jgi:MoxR-like ATPase
VQAHALVDGRLYALPDDVKILAPKVLGHRIMPAVRSALSARRNPNDAAGERIIEEILTQIEVPL